MRTMQGAEKHITDRRDARETRILVTGVTGFLGSHLMAEFLRRGYPVIALCRSKEEVNAAERISRLLKWFGMGPETEKRLEVVEAFLDQPHLGLGEKQYAHLMEQTDEVFHCAGETSFAEKKRADAENANLKGLGFLLDMALSGRCTFFHYVSTAYVAGKKVGICPERHIETRKFTNVYEETKHRAEKLVLETSQKGGLRCNIYRPSIVYGDSVTGRTLRFNALYYPVRTAHYFRDLYLKDISSRGGRNAKKMGVRTEEDGRLHLPVRIANDTNGRLNVIPVDFFVKACLAIMEESLAGDIFHIVSNSPSTLAELVEYTERFLNITGLRTFDRDELQGTPKNAFDLLVDSYIDIYQPYMQDTRIFESKKADAILEKKGIRCPALDYGIFEKCMSYGVDVEWGKRLYREGVLVK